MMRQASRVYSAEAVTVSPSTVPAHSGSTSWSVRHDATRCRESGMARWTAVDACTSRPRRAIYTAGPSGDLSLTYDSQSTGIGELTVSRDTVWFSDGRELGIIGSDRVAETSTAPFVSDAKLSPSANGDVWAISAGTLRRFSRVASPADRAALWDSSISPIFARVCANCHEPNGVAGIDLSTADAWEGERLEIRQRVIEARTMPPQGHELAETDRAAIAAWLQYGL